MLSINGPVNICNTNMDPQRVRWNRQFYVPVGTTNLALHKPVTASCKPTVGSLDLVNYLDDYTGKLIDANGVKGRYVRLYSNGNNENKFNHYVEVEVFGKPVP